LLTQSLAIIEYLHDIYPEAKLLPTKPEEKAKVRMVSEMINSGIQPIQNLSVMQYYSQEQAERAQWAKHWITQGFRALEKILSETSGSCCVGDSVSMADCCLVPQVYNATRFGVDMSEFPNITRVQDNVSKMAAFIKAQPSNQPDCPPELR